MKYRIKKGDQYWEQWRFSHKNGNLTGVWGDTGALFDSIDAAKGSFYNGMMHKMALNNDEYEIISVRVEDAGVVAKITL